MVPDVDGSPVAVFGQLSVGKYNKILDKIKQEMRKIKQNMRKTIIRYFEL